MPDAVVGNARIEPPTAPAPDPTGAARTLLVCTDEALPHRFHELLCSRGHVVVAPAGGQPAGAHPAGLPPEGPAAEQVCVIGLGAGCAEAVRVAADPPVTGTLVLVSPELDNAAVELLRARDVPTLIIMGTEVPRALLAAAREQVRLLPQGSLALAYAAGVVAHDDRPEALVDCIADFAERGLGFARSTTSSLINP